MSAVTREDAISFLETACRNWSKAPKLSEEDIGDVSMALLQFVSLRSKPVAGASQVMFDKAEALERSLASEGEGVNAYLRDDIEAAIAAIRSTLSLPAQEPVHPDDLAVDRFAAEMKAKLAKKRGEGRGGWDRKDECTAEFLSQLLREHVEKGDPVDVGNLAMMLQQRGERIIK